MEDMNTTRETAADNQLGTKTTTIREKEEKQRHIKEPMVMCAFLDRSDMDIGQNNKKKTN